jgi:hypothetical protein
LDDLDALDVSSDDEPFLSFSSISTSKLSVDGHVFARQLGTVYALAIEKSINQNPDVLKESTQKYFQAAREALVQSDATMAMRYVRAGFIVHDCRNPFRHVPTYLASLERSEGRHEFDGKVDRILESLARDVAKGKDTNVRGDSDRRGPATKGDRLTAEPSRDCLLCGRAYKTSEELDQHMSSRHDYEGKQKAMYSSNESDSYAEGKRDQERARNLCTISGRLPGGAR